MSFIRQTYVLTAEHYLGHHWQIIFQLMTVILDLLLTVPCTLSWNIETFSVSHETYNHV